ncbi:MAG: flagellar biosynthesis protein FlhB [Acetobacteraceae bacterium]
MAEEEQGAAERTEAPTPRRLEKAREEGQVPVSKDVSAAAALMGATIGLGLLAPHALPPFASALLPLIERPHAIDGGLLLAALWPAASASFMLLLAVVGLALVLGTGATLLQTKLLFSAKPLRPKLSKVSPIAGVKRLVSPENLMEFVKSVVKLGALCAVATAVLWDAPSRLLHAAEWEPATLLSVTVADSFRLLLALLGALALIAALDVGWMRYRHVERLRMSRQDIKEEMRQSDGDPEVKARLKRIRAERARTRMLAAVPEATVVVTNPTHYAVALRYDRAANAAPRVVAKGVDHLAARIRAAAEEHGIPIVANPPLARALYTVELDREIPEEHYAAVAEIIAYVWRVKGLAQRHAG